MIYLLAIGLGVGTAAVWVGWSKAANSHLAHTAALYDLLISVFTLAWGMLLIERQYLPLAVYLVAKYIGTWYSVKAQRCQK